jgi:type IV pilus assembly protein PilW
MKSLRSQTGVTLIELMIAMAIASLITLGTVRLYVRAAATYAAVQSEQSLEETARLAMSVLRADIEQAGFFGLLAADDPLLTGFGQSGVAVRGDCGDDWSIRLREPIAASDNRYTWTCNARPNAAVAGSDTLELRYVDPAQDEALEAGRIYLRTSASEPADIFVARQEGQSINRPLVTTNRLRTHGYYVSAPATTGTDDARFPALRIKRLTRRGSRPAIVDAEIQPGVEDMQIEFLTDSNEFIDPSSRLPDDRVRAVRIWLLIRSNTLEANARSSIPAYANRSARDFADGYFRKLFQFTLAVNHAPIT